MNKVVLLGFDGLSWNLINQMISEGKLKNIQEIIKNGVSGNLRAEPPLISPKIWTSMFTGKTEEHHGILDFYSSAQDLEAQQIWDIIAEQDATVGIYRPLSAWDVKKLDDFFIPGFFSLNPKAYPEKYSIISELDQTAREDKDSGMSRPKMVKSFWKFLKLGYPLSKLTKLIFKSLILLLKGNKYKKLELMKSVEFLIHATFFKHLLAKFQPDFSLLYENSSDSLSHKFWAHINGVSEYSNSIRDMYEKIDSYIGKIKKFCEKNAHILIILSDHGFKSIGDHQTEEGAISLDVEAFLDKLGITDDVYGVSLAVEYVFRIKPDSSLTYETLIEKFQRIECNGEKLFDLVREMNRIILRFRDIKKLGKFNILNIEGLGGVEFKVEDIVEFDSDNTGTHSDEDGVFFAIGKNIKKEYKLAEVKPVQILPTILAIMGLKLPSDLDGQFLKDIFVKIHEVEFFDETISRPKSEGQLDEDEEKIVKERLRSLGYL